MKQLVPRSLLNTCCRQGVKIANNNRRNLSIDSKSVQEFAANNRQFAKEAVEVPSLSLVDYTSQTVSTDIDEYLVWRGWDKQYVDNQYTNALLSHLLTFPLTFAKYADFFMDTHSSEADVKELRICCVGSRAEANLPDDYWREFLIAIHHFHGNENQINWVVDCIGPEIAPQLKSKQITADQESMLTLNYHKGFLHDHVVRLYKNSKSSNPTQEILNTWNGFLLYNPGIGHPNLIKSWRPSLDFIAKTSKKVLITAHSDIDATRDSKVLHEIQSGSDIVNDVPISYEKNAFKCKTLFEDPCASDEAHATVVSPNHAVCAIKKLS
ncbi:hypothetical protein CTEN210_01381 [Chaetoceros tenuissimus]|uniref:Mitochondrial splicing suppressor 51-like C-terminal domain-containing protein n=1 Tax=Chaetoceros tenuissimus TaxID=426638 RepID=A0AAD3CF11_9STRA|nr:hypothetical protein CTEN210_01381 [Chaetoceros tenuissimus]